MDTEKSKVACVVPSHKQELTDSFLKSWKTLFEKHNVEFILVNDSDDKPFIVRNYGGAVEVDESLNLDLISNHCAGVRQLGFLYIAQKLPDIEYIITLDTDVSPIGDPIQDHIDQLNRKVPISWISTGVDTYFRGFPYGVREEAQVMMSHGIWETVPDYDAPTQLLTPKDFKPEYYKGVIPKGIFFPMCGMNISFKKEALPYIYFAPVGQYKGAERFDDIFGGLEIVKDFAKLNWGIVTGYARVNHLRASNVFNSLEHEAVGIKMNEIYWKGEYDDWYKDFIIKRQQWFELCTKGIK